MTHKDTSTPEKNVESRSGRETYRDSEYCCMDCGCVIFISTDGPRDECNNCGSIRSNKRNKSTATDTRVIPDGGIQIPDKEDASPPPLSHFDPWKIGKPSDGIVWLYKADLDGGWRIIKDADMALQEATGYPVGELVDHESRGEYTHSESGELRAIFVSPDDRRGVDWGVAADRLICQNISEHEYEDEVRMVDGPHDGLRCPECGRMAGGPDLEIPYVDEGDSEVDTDG